MTPKRVNKDEKKQEIIFAAMQVFSGKGVANTKITDIAKAANIGKGTVYEYFKNKKDIFVNVFNMVVSQTLTEISESIKDMEDPSNKLKQIFSLSISSVANDHFDMALIMLDIWSEGIRENRENRENINSIFNIEQIYNEYRSMVTEILQEGIEKGYYHEMNTTVVASVFIGALDGISLQRLMQKDLFDLSTLTNDFINLFLNGIVK
ncbi:MAG: TetR/AcrR family transcriptional regulator [Candidatus Cloacimonetes bacterium]|nr:TetR/AcrR family transcriptional regulator [Candidatus Cloacimonadota bacterium]